MVVILVLVEIYVENSGLSYSPNNFLYTANVGKTLNFKQGDVNRFFATGFSQLFYPHSTVFVEKLQTGVYICRNITDMVLQGLITGFQHRLYFFNGVQNSGVVFTKLFANIRKA